jgi:hypothetical protein
MAQQYTAGAAQRPERLRCTCAQVATGITHGILNSLLM